MDTITEEYRVIQQRLHADYLEYGSASKQFSTIVIDIMKFFDIKSISDYGAGKKRLIDTLTMLKSSPLKYFAYDPAFPQYGIPMKADLVCCIDVLEHIEPNLIDNVIEDLSKIIINVGFFTVHQTPAKRILSDGRNAHLILKPTHWWMEKFEKYFSIFRWNEHEIGGKGFWVVVKSKNCN